nr:MAG TPA: hypothetical protein [Caudoviricetes sp.]
MYRCTFLCFPVDICCWSLYNKGTVKGTLLRIKQNAH